MKHLYPALIILIVLTLYSADGVSQTLKESDPVILANFTTQLVNNKVLLAWGAQQKEGLNYYGIERSYDNKTFNQVALLFPAEDTAAVNNYSYKDPIKNKKASVMYYRLRLVDKDGKYKYSEIRTVRMGGPNGSAKAATWPAPNTQTIAKSSN